MGLSECTIDDTPSSWGRRVSPSRAVSWRAVCLYHFSSVSLLTLPSRLDTQRQRLSAISTALPSKNKITKKIETWTCVQTSSTVYKYDLLSIVVLIQKRWHSKVAHINEKNKNKTKLSNVSRRETIGNCRRGNRRECNNNRLVCLFFLPSFLVPPPPVRSPSE